MNKHRLQKLDIEAWSYILRQHTDLLEATVNAVTAEPITANVTRYVLVLAGLEEPITLVGKETTAVEALFYEQHAHALPHLAPHCWLATLDETDNSGWVLLDDLDHHHAPITWHFADVERMVSHLATLHITFWDEAPLPTVAVAPTIDNTNMPEPVLPYLLGPPQAPRPVAEWRRRVDRLSRGWARPRPIVHPLTLIEAGRQTPLLLKAQAGLKLLRRLGGWPGIVDAAHLQAAELLLNNPDLLLTPLREIPYTLLHGQPEVDNWVVSLLEREQLLGWHTAVWGPAPLDLVVFLESFYERCSLHEGNLYYHEWEVREETLIDGYFLQLAKQLPPESYDARYLRRYALPAARCLHVLTHWFPIFADWFMRLPHSRHTWEMLAAMDDQQLAAIGYTPVVGVRPHLKLVFDRFLNAFRLLCM